MWSFFMAGNTPDPNCDYTLLNAQPLFTGSLAVEESGQAGANYFFSAQLSPGDTASAKTIINGGPSSWLADGSLSKGSLPTNETPGARQAWVFDANREGGGTGCLAYWDGSNWLRVSDNALIS